jgi:hypothetical protein
MDVHCACHVTVCAGYVVSFLWMFLQDFCYGYCLLLQYFTIDVVFFTICILYGDVVSFYNILLWMLSPFTLFYYECCLLLHYFAMDVVSFCNIYYGCCLLLRYFTNDVVTFTIGILYGFCLLGFYNFLHICCLFLLRSDNRSVVTHRYQVPFNCFNLYCFFVQVYQLLNENYVEGGTYSA